MENERLNFRIKMFESDDINVLEKAVNDFCSNVDVESLEWKHSGYTHYILIIYSV